MALSEYINTTPLNWCQQCCVRPVVCALIDCQQSTSLPRRVDPLEKELKMERRVEIDDMAPASTATSGFIDRPSDAPRASFHPPHVSPSFLPPSLDFYSFIFHTFIVCRTIVGRFSRSCFDVVPSTTVPMTTLCNYRAPGRSRVQLLMTPFIS